uniref:Hemerythrin-like domain-containing protein n=1 Tax=Moniliophthora roreri TaxID=221103 RepID=A0A0W0FH42_MONRR
MSSAKLREEKRWNRLSEHMDSFHQWFKEEYNTLYEVRPPQQDTVQPLYWYPKLADGSFTNRGLSLSLYLDTARRLNHHLTMHHTIEERHIFPLLATRMKEFSSDSDHLKSHEEIHNGLAKLQDLVIKFKEDPSSYSPGEMRACLDSFREVLFAHLDQEVSDLRGENLRKYWTLEEVDKIPM